jgi:dephospho-CoA kinase
MRVVVYTPKETQLQRLVNREGLSFEDAQKRIDSQMDIEVKKQKADWVIDNSKDLKHLQAEVEKFVDFIRGEYVSIKI